jgi:hypothetical protein
VEGVVGVHEGEKEQDIYDCAEHVPHPARRARELWQCVEFSKRAIHALHDNGAAVEAEEDARGVIKYLERRVHVHHAEEGTGRVGREVLAMRRGELLHQGHETVEFVFDARPVFDHQI